MYYSAIGFLAIIILFIVNWNILFGPRVYEKKAWNSYRKFLYAILAYYVTDVLWGLLEYYKLATGLFVDTTVYFVAMAVGISFWAEYTVAFLDEKNEKSTFGRCLVYVGRAIAGAIFLLTVVNVFHPVLFSVDEGSAYVAHPARYVMLVIQILFLISISVHALSKVFQMQGGVAIRFRILAAFGFIMAICLFIQLWFPYLPLYSIAYMLGTCLLHAFVVNDEKEEYQQKLNEAGKIGELKDRFKALLDNIPGMAFTKDAETGKYLACNQALADYAHKPSPEGVIGLTDQELFDAETAAHFVEADKIALSLSKPYIFYEDAQDAAGNVRQLQTTKLKYTDTEGRFCILGMSQDITDFVSIQREQAKTKEAYETAVSMGRMYNHMAQTLARDYVEMFYVNLDTEEFTEYRREEGSTTLSEVRRGWHFFSDCKAQLCESVYSEDQEAFLQALHRKKLVKALEQKDTFVLTHRRMILGRPVYFSMKISSMENDEGFIIVGFTDVDAQMREVMSKNEALSDALSSAQAANKAKKTILSGMGHEIRTPINAIIGLDTLALKKSKLDDQTREYFEKIGDNARQLLTIINDVLNVSRLESGREKLQNSEFSIDDLLEQVSAWALPQCSDKGLTYECQLLTKVDASYFGDDVKLKEVLLNVLSNAVKFTKKGGKVTITAEKHAEYKDQASLRFCIVDTGIGMDKECLSKLFDGFARNPAADRSTHGGSGLGMVITKSIVEMMNGSISVESQENVGTTVTIEVPLRKGEGKETERVGEIDLQALYVLVVDDNPVEAEHARTILEEVGISAESCTSGQEALQKMEVQHARKQPFTLVLMDWNMPGMNGLETSSEIQRLYGKESTVVAMTAYNWGDICEEAKRVGVESFLAKPLFAATIVANLEMIAHQCNLAVFKEKKRARLEGRRILLAEDVEINAEILMDMLEMDNIKVDHAENGKVAVELFEQSTEGIYSAILMDVRMPEMDGLEASKAIRVLDREDAKRIPIIALTANSFDEDVQLSLQAGMNAHLSKPVEAEHLIKILGELIYESEEKMTYWTCPL